MKERIAEVQANQKRTYDRINRQRDALHVLWSRNGRREDIKALQDKQQKTYLSLDINRQTLHTLWEKELGGDKL